MNITETVFVEESIQPVIKLEPLPSDDYEASADGAESQQKIGEIFRLKTDELLFVCTHCGVKFPLYNQFVAHTEVHLRQLLLQVIPIDAGEHGSYSADEKPSVGIDDLDHTAGVRWLINDWFDGAEAEMKIEIEDDANHSNVANQSDAPASALECGVCKKNFANSKNLHVHMKLHASDVGAACPICDRKFAVQPYVTEHMRLKHKEQNTYQCDKCDARFRLPIHLRQHQQTHRSSSPILQRTYECHRCHQTFDTLPQCYNHLNDTHWNPAVDPAQCMQCKTWYKSKAGLLHHNKLRICNVDPKAQLQCDICFKEFKFKRLMREHRRLEHSTPKPAERIYKCTICDEEFLYNHQKKTHMNRHRRDERVANEEHFKCSMCPKKCTDRYSLKNHITSHNEDAKFECEICHKTLRLSTKREHMKRHEDNRSHQCAKCGMRFVTLWSLNHHMIAHSDERAHQCGLCPKNFKTAWSLKIHMESHTGDYKYKCKLCSYGASWRASLKKHSLTVHGKPLEDEPSVARFSALTKKKN